MALLVKQQIRITAQFKNEEGVLIDPGAVICEIKGPDRHVTELGANKTGVGVYSALFTPLVAGTYFVRWEGTSPLVSAAEESFRVETSQFY